MKSVIVTVFDPHFVSYTVGEGDNEVGNVTSMTTMMLSAGIDVTHFKAGDRFRVSIDKIESESK